MMHTINIKDSFYTKYGKRIFDFSISFLALSLISPIFFLIGILIKIESSGPIFFTQVRIGQNFCKFRLYKFRTMVQNAPLIGPSITRRGDPRVTNIGKFLRHYKIDELPQLINVLKGEMSLVGPRPEVEKYVKIYISDYNEILKLKPGITDYAAITFRNEEEILQSYSDPEIGYIDEILPKKIKLYKRYLKDVGFFTDLKIILKTIIKIFLRK